MRKPFDSRSATLVGVGFGILLAASIFGQRIPYYQLVMSTVAIVFLGAGLTLGVYGLVAFKREQEAPSPETSLEDGEYVLKVQAGGRRISRFQASVGKWYLTNKRLIFEGSKPRAFGSEDDMLALPLSELAGAEIVRAGRLDKYLEAAFKNEKIQMVGRNLETLKALLEEAMSARSKCRSSVR